MQSHAGVHHAIGFAKPHTTFRRRSYWTSAWLDPVRPNVQGEGRAATTAAMEKARTGASAPPPGWGAAWGYML
jgi:hypothetical protein